jgi:hypothetical protein
MGISEPSGRVARSGESAPAFRPCHTEVCRCVVAPAEQAPLLDDAAGVPPATGNRREPPVRWARLSLHVTAPALDRDELLLLLKGGAERAGSNADERMGATMGS